MNLFFISKVFGFLLQLYLKYWVSGEIPRCDRPTCLLNLTDGI